MIPEAIQWKKHNPDRTIVYDGDVYLVALEVKNNKTGKSTWEVAKVRINCDEDYFDMINADCEDSSSYDYWDWEDFEYSVQVGS